MHCWRLDWIEFGCHPGDLCQEQQDQPDGGAAEMARARRQTIMDEIQQYGFVLDVCIWEFDFDHFDMTWRSGCHGEQQEPIKTDHHDDGPLQWGWRFCPFCKSPIVQRFGGLS